jgi:cytochrome P450
MGLAKGVILGYYGESWRVQRKLFHQYMNKVSVRQYWPAMEQESRTFVLRVLDDNEKFWEETRL